MVFHPWSEHIYVLATLSPYILLRCSCGRLNGRKTRRLLPPIFRRNWCGGLLHVSSMQNARFVRSHNLNEQPCKKKTNHGIAYSRFGLLGLLPVRLHSLGQSPQRRRRHPHGVGGTHARRNEQQERRRRNPATSKNSEPIWGMGRRGGPETKMVSGVVLRQRRGQIGVLSRLDGCQQEQRRRQTRLPPAGWR